MKLFIHSRFRPLAELVLLKEGKLNAPTLLELNNFRFENTSIYFYPPRKEYIRHYSTILDDVKEYRAVVFQHPVGENFIHLINRYGDSITPQVFDSISKRAIFDKDRNYRLAKIKGDKSFSLINIETGEILKKDIEGCNEVFKNLTNNLILVKDVAYGTTAILSHTGEIIIDRLVGIPEVIYNYDYKLVIVKFTNNYSTNSKYAIINNEKGIVLLKHIDKGCFESIDRVSVNQDEDIFSFTGQKVEIKYTLSELLSMNY